MLESRGFWDEATVCVAHPEDGNDSAADSGPEDGGDLNVLRKPQLSVPSTITLEVGSTRQGIGIIDDPEATCTIDQIADTAPPSAAADAAPPTTRPARGDGNGCARVVPPERTWSNGDLEDRENERFAWPHAAPKFDRT